MTLYVGDKLVKCDENGVPVTGESGVFFEVATIGEQDWESVRGLTLKKLADPAPAQEAGADDEPL